VNKLISISVYTITDLCCVTFCTCHQVATIKGILEKLLPSIKIFLDVESLDDLHALDQLIIGSKAVLIFLTTGCLRRYFVRLEVSSAANNDVKTILVRETDDRHGCTPLKEHRSDCPDDARQAVFDSGRKEILWIRAAHYKLVSIKQIVQRMLVNDSDVLPELVLPGEVSLRTVVLPSVNTEDTCHFWLPDCAPWCSRLKTSLQEALPGLSVRQEATGEFAIAHGQSMQAIDTVKLPAYALLIPLNEHTLEDEGVQRDLMAALQVKIQLVLLHVQDDEFGAVPFGRFFEQCPDHLRSAGLFDELACAWFFHEPHLGISCKTVGMKLEKNKTAQAAATKKHGSLSKAVQLKSKVQLKPKEPLANQRNPMHTVESIGVSTVQQAEEVVANQRNPMHTVESIGVSTAQQAEEAGSREGGAGGARSSTSTTSVPVSAARETSMAESNNITGTGTKALSAAPAVDLQPGRAPTEEGGQD
jgi:hypothetical protein